MKFSYIALLSVPFVAAAPHSSNSESMPKCNGRADYYGARLDDNNLIDLQNFAKPHCLGPYFSGVYPKGSHRNLCRNEVHNYVEIQVTNLSPGEYNLDETECWQGLENALTCYTGGTFLETNGAILYEMNPAPGKCPGS